MPVRFTDYCASLGHTPETLPSSTLYDFIQQSYDEIVHNAKFKAVPNSPLGQEVRRRCKVDLAWLIEYFCWGTNPYSSDKDIEDNLVTGETHQLLFQAFVQKDPTKTIAQQDTRKDRLILWPRGGNKSTCDIIDGVQWILVFPDIRILFLTAEDDLAVGFVDELKGHFVIREDSPTLMNLFFPEYCVLEKDLGNQFEFTCPIWKKKGLIRKEPTVQASSIGSNLSGRHYEILKADDVVSNRNSENADQCAKIGRQFRINRKVLMPIGYCDMIGTRYHDEDMYGEILLKNVGDVHTTSGDTWVRTENDTTGRVILIGRAIVMKREYVQRCEAEGKNPNYIEATQENVHLLLPQSLSYAYLVKEFTDDDRAMESQYNQNPKPDSSTTFDRALLLRSTIPFQEMPQTGPISHTWDFAFAKKDGRDYSTGSSVIWDNAGKAYVHDLVRDRYKPLDLAKAIVSFAQKWHPFVITIENAAGSYMLEPTIRAEALKTNDSQVIDVCSRIDWAKIENQRGAKKMRMATLHPWFANGMMKIVSYLPFLETLYSEFEKCMTTSIHDDIPDVISRQVKHAPGMQKLWHDVTNPLGSTTQQRLDATYNLLYAPWLSETGSPADAFGRLGFEPPPPIVDTESDDDGWYEAVTDPILGVLG